MYLTAAASHASIYHMSFLQAIVLGLIQGFFELFPLSSLGHTVLIPSWFGGNWALGQLDFLAILTVLGIKAKFLAGGERCSGFQGQNDDCQEP